MDLSAILDHVKDHHPDMYQEVALMILEDSSFESSQSGDGASGCCLKCSAQMHCVVFDCRKQSREHAFCRACDDLALQHLMKLLAACKIEALLKEPLPASDMVRLQVEDLPVSAPASAQTSPTSVQVEESLVSAPAAGAQMSPTERAAVAHFLSPRSSKEFQKFEASSLQASAAAPPRSFASVVASSASTGSLPASLPVSPRDVELQAMESKIDDALKEAHWFGEQKQTALSERQVLFHKLCAAQREFTAARIKVDTLVVKHADAVDQVGQLRDDYATLLGKPAADVARVQELQPLLEQPKQQLKQPKQLPEKREKAVSKPAMGRAPKQKAASQPVGLGEQEKVAALAEERRKVASNLPKGWSTDNPVALDVQLDRAMRKAENEGKRALFNKLEQHRNALLRYRVAPHIIVESLANELVCCYGYSISCPRGSWCPRLHTGDADDLQVFDEINAFDLYDEHKKAQEVAGDVGKKRAQKESRQQRYKRLEKQHALENAAAARKAKAQYQQGNPFAKLASIAEEADAETEDEPAEVRATAPKLAKKPVRFSALRSKVESQKMKLQVAKAVAREFAQALAQSPNKQNGKAQ